MEKTGPIQAGMALDARSGGIGQVALLAMAVAGGIAVANIYYNQPMLGIIESEFGGQSITGMVPTATQLGYALGLFLLLPLGDLVNRRKMIIGQFVMLAAALGLAALAPSAWMLVAASVIVGACSTVAQQIVPFAASLAAPEKRGATIGTVMAGVLSGILFSRTLSGFVGEHAGWREMFWIGVPLALVAAGLMFAVLPHHRPTSLLRYHRALQSLGHLWKRHPALRAATTIQASCLPRSQHSGPFWRSISQGRSSNLDPTWRASLVSSVQSAYSQRRWQAGLPTNAVLISWSGSVLA